VSENIRSPDAHRAIWRSFSDFQYRHGYAEGFTGDYLAAQIHALRTQRDWNQTELAAKAVATQPQISGWETSCENVRLTSLHRLAEAFDVALVVKFVPFSELAREVFCSHADRHVPSFEDDSPEAISFPSAPIRFQPVRRSGGRIDGGSDYVSQFTIAGTRSYAGAGK
jgi:transcriptional regulator with XRE-family HTH domain